jgi:antitoxin CptB
VIRVIRSFLEQGSGSKLGEVGVTRMQDESDEMQRLRWQCRRGMLELDLLLERFLEAGYPELSDREKAVFTSLLDYQDQDIQEWVMGQAEPADEDMRLVVARLRQVRW